MRRSLLLLLPVVLLAAACGAGSSDGTTPTTTAVGTTAASSRVKLVKLGTFDSPVYVAGDPTDSGRVFVVEQSGRIRTLDDGTLRATPFLDIRSRVTSGGEQGLLSMAFAPDYAKSGRFYVYYTDKDENQRVVEFKHGANDELASVSSARTLLVIKDHEPNHNGGQLQFGPDKMLYIGTGDGGGGGDQHPYPGNAQNLHSLWGKILRINPKKSGSHAYTIPKGNPFRTRGGGVRHEIYAYGFRNPWRWSFDRRTGDMVIGDVGEHAVEEIDFRKRGTARGKNFGWRVWEGRQRYQVGQHAVGPVVFPQITHNHAQGWCAIIGGYVVRDLALKALTGRYLYSDECEGRIWSAKLTQARATSNAPIAGLGRVGAVSSFGQDRRGRVYVATSDGPVYRLAAR
jgi:glucose/arabinose dehydrogenase